MTKLSDCHLELTGGAGNGVSKLNSPCSLFRCGNSREYKPLLPFLLPE